MNRRVLNRLALGAAVVLTAPLAAPQLLAFPYAAQVRAHRVRSVDPITPAIVRAVEIADRRVAAGPLGQARRPDEPIFLTGGGWRWAWLALTSRGAMALTRPINDAVIVNRIDPTGRDVLNGRALGGRRSLEGVIAHEMTHGSLRAHFGPFVDVTRPQQLREGFCDYVAGGGTLSDAEAGALLRAGADHPALPYWQGRKRVEAAMARPDASVDRLFADWKD